jgi:branched-subunit amino acid aminotransferase/4-amino-4-deoxychorismate lyase
MNPAGPASADGPASDPQVDLNGRLLRAAAAGISPLSEGFLYGRGLFETIKVAGGRPIFFAEHAERLRRGALALGLVVRSGTAGLLARCLAVIAANRLEDGAVKLVAFQGLGGVDELILPRAVGPGPDAAARGFRLQTMAGAAQEGGFGPLKTLNYLRQIGAKRAAQAAGFDEPILFGADGALLEGATTNVFVVRSGRAATPALDGRVLPGIVRAKVLELGSAAEGRVDANDLRAADEVFVTNSLVGVMPVAQVDERRYDLGRNPVTRAAIAALRELERRSGAEVS